LLTIGAPDLTVTGLDVLAGPQVNHGLGEYFRGFRLSNRSDFDVNNARVHIELRRDSEQLFSSDLITDIHANESRLLVPTVDFEFPDSGIYYLTVGVDTENNVEETDENNNTATAELRILPDLRCSELHAPPIGHHHILQAPACLRSHR